MKLKTDYKSSPRYLEGFGLDTLNDIEKAAESIIIPVCPCCGSEAFLVLGFLYNKPAVDIQCGNCGIRTTSAVAYSGCPPFNRSITPLEAVESVARVWTRRI